jgi:hypothetical protein
VVVDAVPDVVPGPAVVEPECVPDVIPEPLVVLRSLPGRFTMVGELDALSLLPAPVVPLPVVPAPVVPLLPVPPMPDVAPVDPCEPLDVPFPVEPDDVPLPPPPDEAWAICMGAWLSATAGAAKHRASAVTSAVRAGRRVFIIGLLART